MSKKNKNRKNRKKIANNYLGMAAISIVAVFLLGTLAVESVNMRERISVYEARAAELEEKISEEQERTAEIDEQKEYMETDEYAAEVARDKLGLIKNNEIVFEEEK